MEFNFSRYHIFIVAVLVFLQFTVILDFMVLSPLGAILMPALHISASQFGLVVSAYAISAGLSGLLAAGFADKFDRKKLLLFFYTGFLIGTLLCGLASTYDFLLLARVVAGLFGGVINSILLAIMADSFPLPARGRVMGAIQASFAASQVLGIPAGLWLANRWGWHSTFLWIAALAAIGGVIIWIFLKPIDGHLITQVYKNPFRHLAETLMNKNHIIGFIAVAMVSMGSFMLMPFVSSFTVHNLGVNLKLLPTVYLITGCVALFSAPFVGRAADHFGKFKIFAVATGVVIITAFIYTHLAETSFIMVIVVTSLLFTGMMSRSIPSQALLSEIPQLAYRGSYLSVLSAVTQLSGGFAAAIAGLIVFETPDGKIEKFAWLGYGLITTSLVGLYMMGLIYKRTTPISPATAIHK